jgi:hypothetical protein
VEEARSVQQVAELRIRLLVKYLAVRQRGSASMPLRRCTWNPGDWRWLNRMTAKVLYESPNGDIWRLVRDPQSGGALVEHQPNASSGGRTSRTDIGQFLRAGGRGPEHQALLALIGTLVDD